VILLCVNIINIRRANDENNERDLEETINVGFFELDVSKLPASYLSSFAFGADDHRENIHRSESRNFVGTLSNSVRKLEESRALVTSIEAASSASREQKDQFLRQSLHESLRRKKQAVNDHLQTAPNKPQHGRADLVHAARTGKSTTFAVRKHIGGADTLPETLLRRSVCFVLKRNR